MCDSFATPRTMACQAPLSIFRISQARILQRVAISSFPSPGDLPNPGKISVQISLQDSPFNSFRYIFRIAGLYGNSVFNFWRSCQIAFHRGYTTSHSHQQCTRVPVSPYPCQRWFFFFFFVTDILTGTRWLLIVILVCISLMPWGFMMFGIFSCGYWPCVCPLFTFCG